MADRLRATYEGEDSRLEEARRYIAKTWAQFEEATRLGKIVAAELLRRGVEPKGVLDFSRVESRPRFMAHHLPRRWRWKYTRIPGSKEIGWNLMRRSTSLYSDSIRGDVSTTHVFLTVDGRIAVDNEFLDAGSFSRDEPMPYELGYPAQAAMDGIEAAAVDYRLDPRLFE